jgi:hypothetical protein
MSVTLASPTDVYYNLQISSVVSVNGTTYYALMGPIAINVSGEYTPTIVYSNALISTTQNMSNNVVCWEPRFARARAQLTVVATLSGLTVNLTTFTPMNNLTGEFTPVTPSTCVGPYFATDGNNTLSVGVATGEAERRSVVARLCSDQQAFHPAGMRALTSRRRRRPTSPSATRSHCRRM